LNSNSSNYSKVTQIQKKTFEDEEDDAKNVSKLNIQMSNTVYDGGFGNNPQKGYYQQQQQMSSSQYVVKGNTSLIQNQQ